MAEKRSIIGITPGAGFWIALESGAFEPVVCFALIRSVGGEDGEFEEVIPLSADDVASGNYETDLIEMAGLVHESDFSDVGVTLKPGRKPRKSD